MTLCNTETCPWNSLKGALFVLATAFHDGNYAQKAPARLNIAKPTTKAHGYVSITVLSSLLLQVVRRKKMQFE